MWVIAGLGNPGPVHKDHRHNIGFMALDRIVRRHFPLGNWRDKFQAQTLEFMLAGQKVLTIKPQNFMNLSGNAVGEAVRFYKVPVTQVIALHDDLDLDLGRFEVKQGGGNGGHNGLRSMDAQLGSVGYGRVRLGIGHPARRFAPGTLPKEQKDLMVHNHVLSDFSKAELAVVDPALDRLADAFPLLLKGETEGFRAGLREPATTTVR